MNNPKSVVAAQLLLIFPAVFFMGALVVRNLQPLQNQPAQTAQQIVMWYAARQWTLWVLLIALPLIVLVTGFVALAQHWSENAQVSQAAHPTLSVVDLHGPLLMVAATTFTAGAVLAIVVIHMLAN